MAGLHELVGRALARPTSLCSFHLDSVMLRLRARSHSGLTQDVIQTAKNSPLAGAHRIVGGILLGNLFGASFGAAALGSDGAAAPGAVLMRVCSLVRAGHRLLQTLVRAADLVCGPGVDSSLHRREAGRRRRVISVLLPGSGANNSQR